MTKSEIIQGVRIVRKPVFQKNLILRIISYLLMIPAAIRLAINADVIFIYGRYFVLHRFIIIMGKILKAKNFEFIHYCPRCWGKMILTPFFQEVLFQPG